MKLEESKVYEAYMDRLSMPMYPIPVSKEENESYNDKNPLPSNEDIQRIMKEYKS